MKYMKYMSYLLRHKWFVGVECWKRGLYWRGLVHDMSKFLPSELIPYTNYFYGLNPTDETGYYRPTKNDHPEFDLAWLKHQKRNPHHWQYWILSTDSEGTKLIPMPEPYRTEMICDWIGAGKAKGFVSPESDPLQEVRKFWNANSHQIQLHINTYRWVNHIMKLNEEDELIEW